MVLVFLLGASFPLCAQPARGSKDATNAQPAFVDADGVRVLEGLRQALESDSQKGFLKLFAGRRMPGYAAFRDQIDEFFGKYDSFRVQYHVTQTAMDGEFGAVLADFAIDAVPGNGAGTGVRRNASMRLVLVWEGKSWKISDLAPRDLFR
jgi:hypothetical protein